MSVEALKSQARRHWTEHLPEKVRALRLAGRLDAELTAAANQAQDEIEHLMKHRHFSVDEAREVALPKFITLPPEESSESDEQDQELAEKERAYQKNPPVM